MNESLYIEFIRGLWNKLSLYVKEKVEPKKRTYLHKTMLRKVYSPDQKWEGTSAKTTYVAADMVAMDSPLPIKKRGSLATSNGKLPKVGMKKQMRETEMNTIDIMKAHYLSATTDEARKAEKARIIKNLTEDAVACSVGIDEKNEANFLTALSEGVVVVEDEENTGTGLRLDYGYFEENTFGTIVKGHVSYEDFENIKKKADEDGNTIVKVMMATSKLNEIRKERWARELVADAEDKVYTDSTTLKVPGKKKFIAAFEDEFDMKLEEVDRSVTIEKNGKQKSIKPWNAERIIFLCNEEVGSLVWGTLAEASRPVPGVKYATVDDYKLISKYSKTDPLQEFTNGQALVAPVIEDVDQIYVLDCTETKSGEVDEDAEEADTQDVTVNYEGKKYSKSEMVTALNTFGKKLKATDSDNKVIAAINSLSDADEKKLLKKVVYFPICTPASLTFAKEADSTGQQVAVDTNDKTNTPTVAADEAWITPSYASGKVTVKVAANSETSAPKRTGVVTVTVGTKTATIAVEQAANA